MFDRDWVKGKELFFFMKVFFHGLFGGVIFLGDVLL